MQVNLDKLLTGLGSGELLHPQNSVHGATVRRASQYDSVLAENASLRNELDVLKQHHQANTHQHQHQPPPPQTLHQVQSLFHQDYVLSLEQKWTSHGTELAHLQSQFNDKTRSLVWQMQQHDHHHATMAHCAHCAHCDFTMTNSANLNRATPSRSRNSSLRSEHNDTSSTCKQSHSSTGGDLGRDLRRGRQSSP